MPTPMETSTAGFAITQYTVLIACIFGIGVVALMRVTKLRDDDGERLPRSLAATFLFLLTHIFLYLAIIGIAAWSPGLLAEVLKAAGISSTETEIPLVAFIAMSGLFAIPQVRDIERDYALFLHSVQYRTSDEEKLAAHLTACLFSPSDPEQSLNDRYLQQFNLYIVERDDSLVRLRSVVAWRKVNALLRRLSQVANAGPGILSAADIGEIRALEEAHRRKTALAVSIIRVLDEVGTKPDDGAPDSPQAVKIKQVSDLLASTPHRTEQGTAHQEELARQIMESGAASRIGKGGRLTLTEEQMTQYLREIEGYFILEYDIILRKLAWLASKSVVRAGDHADAKLQNLKTAGFSGLGSIEQVTLDRVVWVLFTTWLCTFIIWSVMVLAFGREIRLNIIIAIAFSTSIAALVGSIWGSRRSLAESRSVPWSSYMAAGTIALAGFIAVNTIRYLATQDTTSMAFDAFLSRIAPYAIMPVLLTIAICRLARLERWPDWQWTRMRERAKDGLAVASVYVIGFLSVMLLRALAGTSPGMASADLSQFTLIRLLFLGVSVLVGFAIGALIVRDVRDLAHSKIIDQPAALMERDLNVGR